MKPTPKWTNELSNFIGTTAYWPICKFCMLTDGAKFLADHAEAYWLMYAIASYLPDLREQHQFVVAVLTVTDHKAILKLDDGNGHVLAKQRLPFTDFPLTSFTCYASWAGDFWVVMLPSEY
jgi:hypothetical protein